MALQSYKAETETGRSGATLIALEELRSYPQRRTRSPTPKRAAQRVSRIRTRHHSIEFGPLNCLGKVCEILKSRIG
jgi:hypothetical protein